jgi:hypothetical protein
MDAAWHDKSEMQLRLPSEVGFINGIGVALSIIGLCALTPPRVRLDFR